MNLQEHKKLVYEYEQAIFELRGLRETKGRESKWFAKMMGHDVAIALPADYATSLVRDRMGAVEVLAKDLADRIGVTFDCGPNV